MLFAPLSGSGSAPGSSELELGNSHPKCSSLSFVLPHIGLTGYEKNNMEAMNGQQTLVKMSWYILNMRQKNMPASAELGTMGCEQNNDGVDLVRWREI